jgi:O-antigen/teichoic acid export membrane protein
MSSTFKFSKFVKDTLTLSSGTVAGLGLNFVASVVLARLLGPEKKGIITALMVIPSLVLSLSQLGIRQAIAYFLGKGIYDDQKVISTLLLLDLVVSFISVVLIAVIYLSMGMPQRYGWAIAGIPLAILPVRLTISYCSGVLLAKQQISTLTVTGILEDFVYLVILVPFILPKTFQVAGALLAQVLAAGIAAGYLLIMIRQYGRLHLAYIQGLPWKFIRMGFIYAIALFILGIHYRLDVIILERLSTSTEVGIYSVGVTVAEMLWLVSHGLTTVLFASSSASRDAGLHAQKTALVLRLTLWGSLIPCLLLYVLVPIMVPVIYGQAFVKSGLVTQAILPGIWMALVFKILNSDLAGRGRPDAAMWVYGLAITLNVALNLWWIPEYGSIGSAWASSISYSVGAIVFAIVYANMSELKLSNLFLLNGEDIQIILGRLKTIKS